MTKRIGESLLTASASQQASEEKRHIPKISQDILSDFTIATVKCNTLTHTT